MKATAFPPNTEVILDSIADGVFTVDKNWQITFFNRAAEEITGVMREDAMGSYCHHIFRANICEQGCALKQTIASGHRIINKTIYIVRPDGRRLPVSISTAVLRDQEGNIVGGVETFRDLSLIENLRSRLIQENSFQDIISRNHQMKKLFSMLPDIARSESTVLIQGDSGTGKELFARSLHQLSGRKDGPLVVVNCGALPDTLLESELFGYKAGAFTDAKKDKPGRFAQAEGGTIFLDEVGDVSPAFQVKLLRIIQEKTYQPLGSNKTCRADLRVVAATNKNLSELMAQGKFRQDLFYRLSVIELKIPPLKERKEDIPLLANHFLQQRVKLQGREMVTISDQAMAVLLQYHYPGNVRELENIIEYLSVLCREETILPSHLPERVWENIPPGERETHGLTNQQMLGEKEKLSHTEYLAPVKIKEMEEIVIRRALEQNNNHRLATARQLGISKATLWRKIKKYQIRID